MQNTATKYNHLFTKTPKKIGAIGSGDFVKSDMTRFVKWPKNVRIQRQRKQLKLRLKVPAPINQFNAPLNSNLAKSLFNLLSKYTPETRTAKRARLQEKAREEVKESDSKNIVPKVLKFGLNHVTQLVESKKAKLVIIAHDVEPIELVVWLPALCRRMGVPYCIVKGKARLGALVHMKISACVALTDVRKEHSNDLKLIIEQSNSQFNETTAARKGGHVLGLKSQAIRQKIQKAQTREAAKMGQ